MSTTAMFCQKDVQFSSLMNSHVVAKESVENLLKKIFAGDTHIGCPLFNFWLKSENDIWRGKVTAYYNMDES